MAAKLVKHVDGKLYRREFPTGRTPKAPQDKMVQQGLKLLPFLKTYVPKWKAITGKSFNRWVNDEMMKVILVYTETV